MSSRSFVVILLFFLMNVLVDGYPTYNPDNLGIAGDSSLPDSGTGGNGDRYPPVAMEHNTRYHGPVAMLTVLPNGHIADTDEVTAARNSHLAALEKAKDLWSHSSAMRDQTQSSRRHEGLLSGGADEGYSYLQPDTNTLVGEAVDEYSYIPPQEISSGRKGQSQGSSLVSDADGWYLQPSSNTLEGETSGEQSYPHPQEISGGSNGQAQGVSAAPNGGYSYPQPSTNTLGGETSDGQSYLPPRGISSQSGVEAQGGSETSWYGYPHPSTNTLGGSVEETQPVSMNYDNRYQGPLAMLMVLPDGYIADTDEVSAARAAHLAAVEKVKALRSQTGFVRDQSTMGHGGSFLGGAEGYHYPQPSTISLGGEAGNGQSYLPPQGIPPGGSSGQAQGVSATADGGYSFPQSSTSNEEGEASGRQSYLHQEIYGGSGDQEQTDSGVSGGDGGYFYPQPSTNTLEGQSYLPPRGSFGGISGQTHEGFAASVGPTPYHGPLAMPVVLPSGYLADTPDVAALRIAHISALLKAQAAWMPKVWKEH